MAKRVEWEAVLVEGRVAVCRPSPSFPLLYPHSPLEICYSHREHFCPEAALPPQAWGFEV